GMLRWPRRDGLPPTPPTRRGVRSLLSPHQSLRTQLRRQLEANRRKLRWREEHRRREERRSREPP
ncbi:MAG: hypothetical protein R3195_10525, partial [Gemmatimonadota bacterium]|nr:hypothetical protein [Gemmatimonadota bacterium]